MQFTMEIKFCTENDAFQDWNRDTEIRKIVHKAIELREKGHDDIKLTDSNGAWVGRMIVKENAGRSYR